MARTSDSVVIAGGCVDTAGGVGAYSCVNASDVIDIFDRNLKRKTARLSEARAWATACAVDNKVIVAGGGTTVKKSRAADVIDDEVRSNLTALSVGRWGMACASAGPKAYFGGGIGGSHSNYLDVVDEVDSENHWTVAPFELSQARESMGALATENTLTFVGGWNELLEEPNSKIIDTFDLRTGALTTTFLPSPAYWPGAASVGPSEVVIDNQFLSLRTQGRPLWQTMALPSFLAGPSELPFKSYESGGAVPADHVPENGISVLGCLACFYGAPQPQDSRDSRRRPPNEEVPNAAAVFCFNTQSHTWVPPLNCSARHKAGGIAAIGDTIFVAGGYDPLDPSNAPTDVVDVFFDVAATFCAATDH